MRTRAPKLIVLRGLPASGKTTKALQLVEKGKGNIIRVSKDDIRSIIGSNESKVKKIEEKMIVDGLQRGFDIVVDSTNLSPERPSFMRMLAKESRAQLSIVDIIAEPEECVRRDSKRPVKKQVGAPAIWGMYNRYLKD